MSPCFKLGRVALPLINTGVEYWEIQNSKGEALGLLVVSEFKGMAGAQDIIDKLNKEAQA